MCQLPPDDGPRLRELARRGYLERTAATVGAERRGLGTVGEALLDSGGHTVLERLFVKLVRSAGLPVEMSPDPAEG